MKTNILYVISILVFSFISIKGLSAQEIPVGYELADSIVYRPAVAVDSTLVGVDVFNKINDRLEQSPIVEQSVRSHVAANKERTEVMAANSKTA